MQSSVGLGVRLVATPIVAMLFPSLMPGAILTVALVLPVATLLQEGGHADLRGFGWAFGGGSPGRRSARGWWRPPRSASSAS